MSDCWYVIPDIPGRGALPVERRSRSRSDAELETTVLQVLAPRRKHRLVVGESPAILSSHGEGPEE